MYVYVVGLDVCMVTRGKMGAQYVRTVDQMDMVMEALMKDRKVVMRGMMMTLSRTLYIDVVSG